MEKRFKDILKESTDIGSFDGVSLTQFGMGKGKIGLQITSGSRYVTMPKETSAKVAERISAWASMDGIAQPGDFDESVKEAVGDSAQPFYELLDDYAGEEAPQPWATIIDELVRSMSGDEVKRFVDDFRRHHDMNHPGEDPEYGEDDPNFESVKEESKDLADLKKLAGI